LAEPLVSGNSTPDKTALHGYMRSPGESGLLAFGLTMADRQEDETEIRKRRVQFRAWHRGTREMDLLLGRFTDAHIGSMSKDEIASLEALMELPDPDIYNWIIGAAVPSEGMDTPLLHKIRDFHLGTSGAGA
jgi:antitoxin CptB